jgi:hypothetical protein
MLPKHRPRRRTHRGGEDSDALTRLVYMTGRLLIISVALGLLALALGGWLVQALRWPSRTLVASFR